MLSPEALRFSRTAPGRTRAAFTIVELLVAAAISAVLAGLMLTIVGASSRLWTRTSGKLAANAQARLVLDQLALDLQSAIYRDDGNVWFAVTVLPDTANSGLWLPALNVASGKPSNASGSLNLATTAMKDARFGVAGTWLRFFTTERGSNDYSSASSMVNTASVPVAVCYQIVRRTTSANPQNSDVRYLFHRVVVRSAQDGERPGTLESGSNLEPAASTNYTRATADNDGASGDPFSLVSPRDIVTVMAENVIDFGVRLYVRDVATGGLDQIFPADAIDLMHLAKSPSTAGASRDRFPDVVDVMVRILTDDGARLIANLETQSSGASTRPAQFATDAAWWWAVAEANSKVFTRRVSIRAQLL